MAVTLLAVEREKRDICWRRAYNEQCPDSVVKEHSGCDEEHHQAGKLGELLGC